MYAIDMMRKNYDIDFKSLLIEQKKHRPRKKQKDVIVGLKMKIILGIIVFVFLIIHITLILIFKSVVNEKTDKFSLMRSQGECIIASYSNLCKETNRIDHTE